MLEFIKPHKPWDCDCNMSKPALYKFTYALIMVNGYFTCSLNLGKQYTPQQNTRNTVFFRIWIPEGKEEKFTEMTGMTLKKPPVIDVNGFKGDQEKFEKEEGAML